MAIREVLRTSLVGGLGAALLAGPLGSTSAQAQMWMTVSPAETSTPPDQVTLSGQCPGIDDPDGATWPTTLRVTMVGQNLSQDVPLDDGGFSDVPFDVPDGLPAGEYVFSGQSLPDSEGDPGPGPGRPEIELPQQGPVAEQGPVAPSDPIDEDETDEDDSDEDQTDENEVELRGLFAADSGGGFVPCTPTATLTVLSTVVIPPTLELEPVAGAAGQTVTARGTCPTSDDGSAVDEVTVLFGDDAVASRALHPATGVFEAEFVVPVDAGLGPAVVETDCGAEQTFTVTLPTSASVPAPPATTAAPTSGPPSTEVPSTEIPTSAVPTETIDGPMIVVPDLRGMTEEEVVAALGGHLTLANPSGRDGHVRSQEPPAGTLVEPASAISVELDREDSLLALIVLAVVLGAAVAALVGQEHLRRRARERRWLDQHVRTDYRPEDVELSGVPRSAVPGLDLRLEVRRDPALLELEEAESAHR